MKLLRSFLKLLATYGLFVMLFVLQRIVFILVYGGNLPSDAPGGWWQSFTHGLPIDLSMAGYLTVLPAVLIIIAQKTGSEALKKTEYIYYGVAAILISAVWILDMGLYSYWKFRLDSTPVFYFMTSPAAAMASVTANQALVGVLALVVLTIAIYLAERFLLGGIIITRQRGYASIAVMSIATATLFIPIRGGFTVAPMNASRAYFSNVQILNHAAVNPMFNLMYSLTHQMDLDSYRYMDDKDAEKSFNRLYGYDNDNNGNATADSLRLTDSRTPDIYIVLLESFSSHLMKSLGGEDLASRLDSIARQGLSFTDFYACGIRTDRAIPSVLSGFPAQPSMSIMKYVDKAAALPSLPNSLGKLGYRSFYYYGGDANFTNMNAYLVNAGFERVVSDKDFPLNLKLSKWGVHDHYMLEKAASDIREGRLGDGPKLVVLQTSSSHEPFEVPYSDPRFPDNKKLNAFSYTDNSVGDFVDMLHREGFDRNALILLVADHYGVYPEKVEDIAERHHIPLVITGGALKRHGKDSTIGSHNDIARTILEELGADASAFRYSRNLTDGKPGHFAVIVGNNTFGMITESDTVVLNCGGKTSVLKGNADSLDLIHNIKAYLQVLYNDISSM